MYKIKGNTSRLHVFNISPPGYPSFVPVIFKFFPCLPWYIFIFFTVFVMLENYMMLQPQDYRDGTVIVQQDGALPHFHTEVYVCCCIVSWQMDWMCGTCSMALVFLRSDTSRFWSLGIHGRCVICSFNAHSPLWTTAAHYRSDKSLYQGMVQWMWEELDCGWDICRILNTCRWTLFLHLV